MPSRFRCPQCGFTIFNRRVPHCEKCKAALPADLLYTPEQIAELDAQAAASRAAQEARRREGGRKAVDDDGEGESRLLDALLGKKH